MHLLPSIMGITSFFPKWLSSVEVIELKDNTGLPEVPPTEGRNICYLA